MSRCDPSGDRLSRAEGLPSRTTGRTRPKERLGAATVIGRVGSVPDERLRRDIEITRPRHGPVSGTDTAKEGVIGAEPLENRTPQQVLDVPLHDGTVGQREAESSTFERRGGSNAKQHGWMLAQRCMCTRRKPSLEDGPCVDRDNGLHSGVACVEVRWDVIVNVHLDDDPKEPRNLRHRATLRACACPRLIQPAACLNCS